MNYKELKESLAHDTAARLGLEYYGFGRYGRHGQVTHISKFDVLKATHQVKPFTTLPEEKLKHLQHADDEVFNNGVEGTRNVLDHINALKHGHERVLISQKIDGAPGVILGTHPTSKKFFVATKSAFNKDPKINYTNEDIDRNHGHAPGLASKLKELLHHGPKLGIQGIVQGDMLYGEHDKEHHGTKVAFKPNTIRYAVDSNSHVGKLVTRSKIGLALHTRYNEHGHAVLNPDLHKEVNEHPDVYVMPVAVNSEKMKFDKDKLYGHSKSIGKLMNEIPSHGWDAITHKSITPHVSTYINSQVRVGNEDYKVSGLKAHIKDKYKKLIDGVKTEKSKISKTAERDTLLTHIDEHAEHFRNAFKLQSHIVKAKHHIIDSLNHSQVFEHTYADGSQANPEGYVAIGHHGPIKFVNRSDFSRQNFNQGTFQK